jgi:hypothetical protein
LASLHIFLLVCIKKLFFFSFSFIFNWIHCCQFAQLEHKITLKLPKGITICKTLIYIYIFLFIYLFLFFDFTSSIIVTFIKKLCKYFVLLMSVIMNDVLLTRMWLKWVIKEGRGGFIVIRRKKISFEL